MKLISILLITSALLFGAGDSNAQEANLFWGGAQYDDGVNVGFGFGRDIGEGLWGGNIWTFGNASVGAESSLNGEVALLFTVKDKFYIGPVAGPNVDWVNDPPTSGLAYLSGAGGGLLGYDISEKTGLWLVGKFKYTFEADNMYRDGWVVGAGGFWRF